MGFWTSYNPVGTVRSDRYLGRLFIGCSEVVTVDFCNCWRRFINVLWRYSSLFLVPSWKFPFYQRINFNNNLAHCNFCARTSTWVSEAEASVSRGRQWRTLKMFAYYLFLVLARLTTAQSTSTEGSVHYDYTTGKYSFQETLDPNAAAYATFRDEISTTGYWYVIWSVR